VQYIDYVIGMNDEIGDKAAIEFAVGFYDALVAYDPQFDARVPVEFAFDIACNAIQLEGIAEQLTPILKKKSNLNQEQELTPNP